MEKLVVSPSVIANAALMAKIPYDIVDEARNYISFANHDIEQLTGSAPHRFVQIHRGRKGRLIFDMDNNMFYYSPTFATVYLAVVARWYVTGLLGGMHDIFANFSETTNIVALQRAVHAGDDARRQLTNYYANAEAEYGRQELNRENLIHIRDMLAGINVGFRTSGFNLVYTLFNKRVGNHVEGYIHYKEVNMYYNPFSRAVTRWIYKFNNWTYDSEATEWGSNHTKTMHPHIASGGLCEGNQANEWEFCRRKENYFGIGLLALETFENYNPTSAYASVAKIRKNIEMYSSIALKFFRVPYDYQNPHHLRALRYSLTNCDCGNRRLIGHECTHESCVTNAKALLYCQQCNKEMHQHGRLINAPGYQYIWRCSSLEQQPKIWRCSTCKTPLYIEKIRGTMFCINEGCKERENQINNNYYLPRTHE